MAFTPITITGHYELPSGAPASGSVDFVLTGSMKDTADKLVIVPTKQTVVLDASGEFSTVLLASNDPTTVPQNVPYKVTERIDGTVPNTYLFVLSHDTPGAALDIADVTQVTGQSALYMMVALLGGADPMDVTTAGAAPGVSGLSSREDHTHHLAAHAASHATAGGDPLAPADIGAASAADLAAKADAADLAAKANQTDLDGLATVVAAKADTATMTAALAAKASVASVNAIAATLEQNWTLRAENAAFAAADHDLVVADYSVGAWATTLPAPAAHAAVEVVVLDPDPGAVSGTLTPNAGEVIHGVVSLVATGDKVLVRSNGVDWYVV